jgi:DNA-binding transcriptional regulator YiaG
MQTVPAIPHVSAEDAKAARLSPRLIRTLRKRLGLSQVALARLVGVSAPAVAHWEAGNSAPKGQNRAHLVALRKMGKREVKELLLGGSRNARREALPLVDVTPSVPART